MVGVGWRVVLHCFVCLCRPCVWVYCAGGTAASAVLTRVYPFHSFRCCLFQVARIPQFAGSIHTMLAYVAGMLLVWAKCIFDGMMEDFSTFTNCHRIAFLYHKICFDWFQQRQEEFCISLSVFQKIIAWFCVLSMNLGSAASMVLHELCCVPLEWNNRATFGCMQACAAHTLGCGVGFRQLLSIRVCLPTEQQYGLTARHTCLVVAGASAPS